MAYNGEKNATANPEKHESFPGFTHLHTLHQKKIIYMVQYRSDGAML